MDDNQREYELHLQEAHKNARVRPAMYLGSAEGDHRWPIRSILRLVWNFRIFRHARHVTIHLSPTQYVVLVESGPLIRPIQRLLTCQNQYVLTDGWDSAVSQYARQCERPRDWRYAWTGPTGPQFAGMLAPDIFSHRFFVGVRFETEFWGQILKTGRPISPPTTLELPASIGFVAAAHLHKDWYKRLPFALEDITALLGNVSDTSYLRTNKTTGKCEFVHRRLVLQFPHTTIVLHAEDDLFPPSTTIEASMQHWLDQFAPQ